VAAAESYIDKLLSRRQRRRQTKFILKDVRVFLNTVERGLELMQRRHRASLRRERRRRNGAHQSPYPEGG
jgi:hypothetical protein